MRNSQQSKLQTVLLFLSAGFFLNLVIIYSCWIRIGFVQFGYNSKYWQVEHVNTLGYRQNGYRLGVHGWAHSTTAYDPSPLSFSYNSLIDEEVADRDTTISTVLETGAAFGWPFQCVSSLVIVQNTRFINESMNISAANQVKWTTVDITPQPKWYFGGIQTGINHWPYHAIPIAIHPQGLAFNTLVFSLVISGSWILKNFIRVKRRQRKGLCVVCGYAIEDFDVCPECGSGHDSISSIQS